MATFDFPEHIPLPRYPYEGSTEKPFAGEGGWSFTVKPKRPLQKGWTLIMTGLKWFLNNDGTYDKLTEPTRNAAVFKDFIESHRLSTSFTYPHPSEGNKTVRFTQMPQIPRVAGDTGKVPEFEVQILEYIA